MSRILGLIVVLAAIVGASLWLAGRDTTKPLTQVEKMVPDNALAR